MIGKMIQAIGQHDKTFGFVPHVDEVAVCDE